MNLVFSVGVDDYTGANRMTRSYMKGLTVLGDRVTLLHPEIKEPEAARGSEPRLSRLSSKDGIVTHAVSGFPFSFSFGVIVRVMRILASERPALVVSVFQSDAKIVGPICSLMRIPFVYLAQNIGEFSGGGLVRFLKKRLWTFLFHQSEAVVVAAGRGVADELVENHGVAKGATRIITNAVDLPPLQPRRARAANLLKEIGAGDADFVILNVGRLDEQKDQLTLVNAAGLLAEAGVNFRLLLVGGLSPTGEEKSRQYREQIVAKVESLGLAQKVIFLGWRNDVPDLLAQVDMYAHSARWEGFPLAVLDAWAAGVPVVTTDCFQLPRAVRPADWGSVVPVGDARSMADAMLKIHRSTPAERQRLGERSRAFAEAHFNLGDRIREMRDCLEAVLESRGIGHVV